MEAKPNGIIQALVNVMADIGHIGKDKKNKMQGYNFRGIDDVYNAVQPALVKNGVVIAPEFKDIKCVERTTQKGGVLFYTTLIGVFKFYHVDGSFIEVQTVGEAMDSSDKSTNKAMSAAYKYAMFQTLAIPTESHIDTEQDNHTVEPKKAIGQNLTSKPSDIDFDQMSKKISGPDLEEFIRVTAEKNKTDIESIKARAAGNYAAFTIAYHAWQKKKTPNETSESTEMAPGVCPNDEENTMTAQYCNEICKTRDGCPVWEGV